MMGRLHVTCGMHETVPLLCDRCFWTVLGVVSLIVLWPCACIVDLFRHIDISSNNEIIPDSNLVLGTSGTIHV